MSNVPGFSCFCPISSVSVAPPSPVFVGGPCVQTQPQQKFSILIHSVQLFILILQYRQRWGGGGSSEYVCLASSSIHSPPPPAPCLPPFVALYLHPTISFLLVLTETPENLSSSDLRVEPHRRNA